MDFLKKIMALVTDALSSAKIKPACIPVKSPVVTSPYGPRVLNGQQQFHDGVDFVACGDNGSVGSADRTVSSIGPGEVIYDKDNYQEAGRWTNPEDSAGNMVIVKTAIGGAAYYVRYLHLGINRVSVGQRVEAGQALGTYADAGYSFGAHLHLDAYTLDWTKIDPTPILRAAGVPV
jgi:murein DD-endopeptidase MepM/ murein hydrolase activator NlpD